MGRFGFGSFKVLLVALLSVSAIWPVKIRAQDSCAGRCNQGTIPGAPCQCNKPCEGYGDCCADYVNQCSPNDIRPVSDQELANLAEELTRLDVANNATRFVGVNLQGRANKGKATKHLLTVSQEAYSRSSIAKFLKLLDNYIPSQLERENFTPEEIAEINDFVDTVLATPVMQRAQAFLREKKLPNGRDNFYALWFELYNRGGQTNSSSGFEHVFVGELDEEGGVAGFHNWIAFAVEETAGRLDYLGYIEYIDFLARGSVIENSFVWRGGSKPVSTMFIGTSPEFELALYTICYHARVNKKCPFSINGLQIQTYNSKSAYGNHIGSAYPDLSNFKGGNSAALSAKSMHTLIFAICSIIFKYS